MANKAEKSDVYAQPSAETAVVRHGVDGAGSVAIRFGGRATLKHPCVRLCKEHTDEWYSLRRRYIGASDAPTLMGSNSYTSRELLMRKKLGMPTLAQKYNRFIEVGKEQESNILRKLTPYHKQPKTMFQSTKWHWLVCSPDAILMRNGKLALGEAKTPAKPKEADSVYKQYKWQTLHQMLVMGYDTCYLVYGKPHREIDPLDPTHITVSYPDAGYVEININDFKAKDVAKYLEVSYAFWNELSDNLAVYDRNDRVRVEASDTAEV